MANGYRWLIVGYSATWEYNYKKIVLTTDVPCHITLRLSPEAAVRHERTTFLRGMPTTRDPHFEFHAYTEIEQVEPGDTLVHTFYIDRWTTCTWRYYYFEATYLGLPTSSRSPFMKQHAPAGAPQPPTMTYQWTEGWNMGDMPYWSYRWTEPWTLVGPPTYQVRWTERWW